MKFGARNGAYRSARLRSGRLPGVKTPVLLENGGEVAPGPRWRGGGDFRRLSIRRGVKPKGGERFQTGSNGWRLDQAMGRLFGGEHDEASLPQGGIHRVTWEAGEFRASLFWNRVEPHLRRSGVHQKDQETESRYCFVLPINNRYTGECSRSLLRQPGRELGKACPYGSNDSLPREARRPGAG